MRKWKWKRHGDEGAKIFLACTIQLRRCKRSKLYNTKSQEQTNPNKARIKKAFSSTLFSSRHHERTTSPPNSEAYTSLLLRHTSHIRLTNPTPHYYISFVWIFCDSRQKQKTETLPAWNDSSYPSAAKIVAACLNAVVRNQSRPFYFHHFCVCRFQSKVFFSSLGT